MWPCSFSPDDFASGIDLDLTSIRIQWDPSHELFWWQKVIASLYDYQEYWIQVSAETAYAYLATYCAYPNII